MKSLKLLSLAAVMALSLTISQSYAVEGTSGPGAGSGASDSGNQGSMGGMEGQGGGLGMGGGAVGASGSSGMSENPGNAVGSHNATSGVSTQQKAANSMFSDAFNAATNKSVTNLSDPIAKAAIEKNYQDVKSTVNAIGKQTTPKDVPTPTPAPREKDKTASSGNTGEPHTGQCIKSYHTIMGEDQCVKNKEGEWVPRQSYYRMQ